MKRAQRRRPDPRNYDVFDVARHYFNNLGIPHKAWTSVIGKAQSTISLKAEGRRVLDILEAVQVMQKTGDITALEWLAAQVDCFVVRRWKSRGRCRPGLVNKLNNASKKINNGKPMSQVDISDLIRGLFEYSQALRARSEQKELF